MQIRYCFCCRYYRKFVGLYCSICYEKRNPPGVREKTFKEL